ncbi:uncharacterized protein LOC119335691 [Triticum dicoccoides]|uniref:uncharacterized protein LOC119335691 n=1 Tax=Triticum dicoccoides TaxID=85692 RepID=UPI001891E108|nr:uncharacterized protein LOC119335691 [Triticum dicoccoides]
MAAPAPAPASIPVPDELLEEIFLRVPSLNALALASAACTSFRRVIKARAFGRRFRALHRPPLLGFMDAGGFHPAQAPHPSAPLAVAVAPSAADFSFIPVPDVVSFSSSCVPQGEGPRWRPRDVRDGRVLLDWTPLYHCIIKSWGYSEERILIGDYEDGPRTKRELCKAAEFQLAVCHPLSRRYMLLPTIPKDLAAQPQDRLWAFEPVLAPNTGDDGEEEPFKVICFARYPAKLVLFVFSSTSRQWSMVESPSFPCLEYLSCFDCVRGCFYWTEPYHWSHHLMVLDTRTMMFSTVDLLTGCHKELKDLDDQSFHRRRPNAVVAGRLGGGALEMFSLVGQHGSFALYHTSLQNNYQEWKLKKIVHLPEQYHDYSISTVGAAEGFLFFQGAPEGNPIENVDCYSMEVKTYEMTKVCSKLVDFSNRKLALPYFSFPPVLSEPTI